MRRTVNLLVSLLLAVFAAAVAVAAAVPAGTAAADSGSVAVTLSPNRPAAASTLSVTAQGPFSPPSGLPTSAAIQVQRGFTSSARSVATLCTAAQAANGTCPAASRIGSGSATATATTLVVLTTQDTISFSLFLGTPLRRGDIASVVLFGTDSLLHQSAHATGRLFKAPGGGLELLFDPLPSYSVPANVTVTLNQLSLSVHATRTVTTGRRKHRRRRRYSLITNPTSCTGDWTSAATLSFSTGAPLIRSLSVPCRPR